MSRALWLPFGALDSPAETLAGISLPTPFVPDDPVQMSKIAYALTLWDENMSLWPVSTSIDSVGNRLVFTNSWGQGRGKLSTVVNSDSTVHSDYLVQLYTYLTLLTLTQGQQVGSSGYTLITSYFSGTYYYYTVHS